MRPAHSSPLTELEILLEISRSRARLEGIAGSSTTYKDNWLRWEKLLLSLGGRLVKHPEDPEYDLVELLRAATIVQVGDEDDDLVYVEGVPHQCHMNASRLWLSGRTPEGKHEIAAVGTGYALSGDGLWRQHSWVMTNTGKVVETTEPCLVYVGVLRTGEMATLFAYLNMAF